MRISDWSSDVCSSDLFKAEFSATDARSSPELHRPNGAIVMQLQTKGSELMRRNLKTLLSTAAVVAALAGGPAVYAYAETPMQNESGSMMQDGQDGMMGQGGIDRKSTRLNSRQ